MSFAFKMMNLMMMILLMMNFEFKNDEFCMKGGGERSSIGSEALFESAGPARTESGGMFRQADDVSYQQVRRAAPLYIHAGD